MKNCPNCQKGNPSDSRFCAFCGAAMGEQTVPPQMMPGVQRVEQENTIPAEMPGVMPAPSSVVSTISAPKPAPMPPVMPPHSSVQPAVFSDYPPAPGYPPRSPWTPPYVTGKVHGGLAIAAFVLSLLALICCAAGLFNIFLYIGIALTIAAWATMKPEKKKGLAVAAIVLSAVALVASFSITVEWFTRENDTLFSYSDPYDNAPPYSDPFDDYDDLYDDWPFEENNRI